MKDSTKEEDQQLSIKRQSSRKRFLNDQTQTDLFQNPHLAIAVYSNIQLPKMKFSDKDV